MPGETGHAPEPCPSCGEVTEQIIKITEVIVHRYQNVLLPRQIGMYLARQLTSLSLEEIGSYFGGRDHSTVLHACRKIKAALGHDFAISGAVSQLQAEFV